MYVGGIPVGVVAVVAYHINTECTVREYFEVVGILITNEGEGYSGQLRPVDGVSYRVREDFDGERVALLRVGDSGSQCGLSSDQRPVGVYEFGGVILRDEGAWGRRGDVVVAGVLLFQGLSWRTGVFLRRVNGGVFGVYAERHKTKGGRVLQRGVYGVVEPYYLCDTERVVVV